MKKVLLIMFVAFSTQVYSQHEKGNWFFGASSSNINFSSSSNSENTIDVTFTGFRDTDLQEKIVSRGGKVSNSISKNTNILVVANKNAKLSGKARDAKKLGIEILEKDEFINKYIDNN